MKNLSCIFRYLAALALTMLATAPVVSAATAPNVALLTPIATGLKTPVRLATDAAGFIYVADPRAGGIVKLAADGSPALDISGSPVTIKTDTAPLGIAVKANGDLLVSQKTAVQLYTMVKPTESATAAYTYTKGAILQPGGGFGLANGIAVATDGTIFVSDSLANKVHIFNGTTNALISSFGSTGNGFGQFDVPTAIAYEKAGNQVAVVDTVNGRVQFFTTAGVFVRSIGSRGTDSNTLDDVTDPNVFFTAPQGVAFEYTKTVPPLLDRMYVVDAYQSRVQVIDPSGAGRRLRYIGHYGTPDRSVGIPTTLTFTDNTAFKLLQPADVLFDPINSRILVANGFSNLISFGIGIGTDPTPASSTPVVTFVTPATITRTGSFTVTGTVDRPAIVTVEPDGAATPACAATFSDTTHWSCTVSNMVLNSSLDFRVKARPISSNGIPYLSPDPPFTVAYLPSAPLLTVNSFATLTALDTITLSGTSDSTTLTVCPANSYVSGSCTATPVTAANPQNWNVALALPATTNSFHITAGATTQDVVIEKIVITPSLLPSGSTVTTPVQNVSGFVNGVTEVYLTLNGAAQPTVVPVVDGGFSTAVTLRNGSNTLALFAKDSAGNATTASTRTITFDPAKPTITVDSMQYGSTPVAFTDGGNVPALQDITVAGTTSGSLVTATLDGVSATVDPNSASWSLTLTNVTPGLHTLLLAADNLATVKRTFQVVAAAEPTVTATIKDDLGQELTTDTVTGSPTITITGVTTNAITVGVTVNGTPAPVAFASASQQFIVSQTLNLAREGATTIVITAYGANGAATSTIRTLIFSQTSPQLVGTVVPNGNNFDITVGPGMTRACIADCSGTNNLTIVGIPAADGTTKFTVTPDQLATLTFFDAAGNSSRNGRIQGGSGEPTVTDVMFALRMSVHGIRTTPEALLRGDVAPLSAPITLATGVVKYTSTPDGSIDIDDVRALFYRAIGLATW